MKKSILALLLLAAGSAFATVETSTESRFLLDSVISKIESTYDLKCELARPQGNILNPYICNPFSNACRGQERFVCRTPNGEKKFRVRAKFIHLLNAPAGSQTEIKRISIRDLD